MVRFQNIRAAIGADAPGMLPEGMEKSNQYMQEIRCPQCAQQGHATWEASDAPGGLRRLATLSEGFRSEEQPGLEPLITCAACGAEQDYQKSVGT